MVALNFKKYGEEGPVLLILHGFLGSLDNWHSLAGQWSSRGIQVYSIDQRNHGRSPHTINHSLDLMVEDLHSFIETNQLAKPNILGHSMGGKVAMQFTVNYPELVDKLIVADIAPRAYKQGAHDEVFKAILSINLNEIHSRSEAEQKMTAYLGDYGTRQFLLKNLERTPNGYQWKFNIETLYRDYQEVIMEIYPNQPVNNRVLFLRGDQSLYIQEKDLPMIATLFPNYRLETIPHAGHWLHADQPGITYEHVLNFILDQ